MTVTPICTNIMAYPSPRSESPKREDRAAPLNSDADPHPLRGVVICCTSVDDEKRTQLAQYAQQMGAKHLFDLTSDVTHLIVGAYDTPKYRYVAKERPDVKPMALDWVQALRELWINDKEINFEALEKEHTLPTLSTLKFSMTGCEDPTERLQIAESVRSNGGIYEGDLTKQITHLISFRTEGAKYKAAKTWGLRIVSIEWLRDSLERGMILDENLYDPILPLEQRGVGAWDQSKKRTLLGKRFRDDSNGNGKETKRKIRRTASARLSSAHEGIWGDIVATGVPQVVRSGVWESNDEQNGTRTTEALKNECRRGSAIGTVATLDTTQEIKGMFGSCSFFLDGFEPKKFQILCNHMLPHGAEICNTLKDLLRSINHTSATRLFRIIPSSIVEHENEDVASNIEVVTEWWVERCLHNKTFLEPSSHVIGRPFPKFPIKEFNDMTISSAAFSGIDLLHLKKAVELIGAKYSEDMTRHSSVLITKSTVGLRKDKSDHAREWNIPILDADWLWDSITAGHKLPYSKYACRQKRRSGSAPIEKSIVKGNPVERSKSDIHKAYSTIEISSLNQQTHRSSKLDTSTFTADKQARTKQEEPAQNKNTPTGNTSDLTDRGSKTPTQPLSEINPNSTAKIVSRALAPSNNLVPQEQEDPDISFNISSLLAKTKKSVQPAQSEAPEARKRGAKKILGRVTSNLSSASAPFSRASSVESTTTGRPAEILTESGKAGSGYSALEQLPKELFLDAGNDRLVQQDIDSQPPATQLVYDDPGSDAYKDRIQARMNGQTVDVRRKLTKQKAITLGDISDANKVRTGTRRKPGFR
ncbi:BRCT domain-containing protein [Bisporella sp. PMI_857]|nr:BRCT domain-containing protein [Bisporella sp. PMI_857]